MKGTNRNNVSFDSYLSKKRRTRSPQKSMNISFFASGMMNDSTVKKRPKTPNQLLKFPPTRTLAEFNQVKYADPTKNVPVPNINEPQRITLPPYFNTPTRVFKRKKEKSPSPPNKSFMQMNDSFMNPNQNNLSIISALDHSRDYNRQNNSPGKAKYEKKVPIDVKVGSLRRINDYQFLSQACKRAGKTREEGRAYYSMGVLYDNIQEHFKAIKFYKKFLTLCQTINDINGEALAYNCLGVNYQILGDENEGNLKHYELAIKYHSKHKDIADTTGKFTACVNLSILYDKLGDGNSASIYQQNALRLALELANVMNQGLAIGNISKIGTFEMPQNKARLGAFVEKYIQICKEQNNRIGQGDGYLKLGQILTDQKKYDEGIDNYEKAYQIGLETENAGTVEKAKFGYGITSGLSKIDDHLENYKRKFNFK